MFEKMMIAAASEGSFSLTQVKFQGHCSRSLTHLQNARSLLALTRARSRSIIIPISCSFTYEKIFELFLALAHSR